MVAWVEVAVVAVRRVNHNAYLGARDRTEAIIVAIGCCVRFRLAPD